jgi:hypothetical protein
MLGLILAGGNLAASGMRALPRGTRLPLVLLLLVGVSLVAQAAEFTASFAPQRACAPQSSVVFIGETTTRIEVVCASDGTATTTFTALPSISSATTSLVTRQLGDDTLGSSAAQQLVRTSDVEGSCTLGGDASCSSFQRCIAVEHDGLERVCADYCDPRRCPPGFSCRLEPAQGCSSIDSTARCPPPVAVCITPNST